MTILSQNSQLYGLNIAKLRIDASVLQSNQRTKEPADLLVLLEEVERACTNSEESKVMYRC